MNYHKEYKAMKKELKITNADVAVITGHTTGTVKHATREGGEFPRWLKLAVLLHKNLIRNQLSKN